MAQSTPRRNHPFFNQFEKSRALKGKFLKDVAKESGVSLSALRTYAKKERLPLPETADLLASYFNNTRLRTTVTPSAICEVCEKQFITSARRKARYCSAKCRNYSNRTRTRRNVHARRAFEIEIYRESVELFCRECVGSDITCPDRECKLRPVSPLPVRERNNANRDLPSISTARLNAPLLIGDGFRLTRRGLGTSNDTGTSPD